MIEKKIELTADELDVLLAFSRYTLMNRGYGLMDFFSPRDNRPEMKNKQERRKMASNRQKEYMDAITKLRLQLLA